MIQIELFRLIGKIVVDVSEAIRAMREASQQGEQTQGKLSKAFSTVGKGAVAVGKTMMTGLAAGGAAMGALTVKALSLSGELEQNMGGSEAVFAEYAGKMQDTAKEAFANMGLSTSDFLATANKMGALFQGAGFSIKESSDLSASAMQRAADVASIMGIDTSAAMEAIAGAAKGNFTMMDNLGVAMNDTTLNAYALEKGINKTTQEMTNQEKIGLAMEMFMDKTAYAAGNYAKENETLAGSLGTAKAALTNFLDGSGDVDSLVTAFSNCANVIVDNIKNLAPRLISGLTDILNQVVPMLPPLLNQLLPVVIEGAVSLINGLVAALPMIIDTIMSALPMFIDGVVQLFNGIVTALPQVIEVLISALPTLIPQLISGIVSMVVTLCTSFAQIIQPIIDYLPEILISVIGALTSNLPLLIEGLIQLILGIVAALPQIIQGLIAALPQIITMIIDVVIQSIPLLIDAAIQIVVALVQALPQIIMALVVALPQILISVWDSIVNVFISLPNWFMQLFDGIISIFSGAWDGIKQIFGVFGEWFSNLWGKLKENPALSGLCEHIENLWNGVKEIITAIFTHIKTVITTAWENIKAVTSVVLDAVKNTISTIWGSIKNTISTVINAVKNVISTAWEAIKTIIKNVMNIIFSIINGDWTSVKNSISNILNAIKSVISSIWEGIKSVISSVLSGIKATVSSVWNGIKSTISSIVSGIKNTVSSTFNSLKSTVSSIWNSIKTAMTKPIESARDAIKGIVDKIKGFFTGMKLEFPYIKLPHFSISPSGWKVGDLLEGSIPKLGIEWYAKAMNNPMLMTEPTIFGYNPSTGRLMGGGEKGAEVVAGANPLMAMIQTAVAAQMNGVSYYLQQLIAMLAEYFPQVIENAGHDIFLDSRQLAVGIAEPINAELGKISARKGRGR